ncbi:MAG: hypothetical protein KGM16_19360 [Bacteroidota bacterium]|nr:hypothetical protein [Bacteroidota bacterium]
MKKSYKQLTAAIVLMLTFCILEISDCQAQHSQKITVTGKKSMKKMSPWRRR